MIEVSEFVDQRIEAILKAPDGWGPPIAVEGQILLMLDTREVAKTGIDGFHSRMQRYSNHLHACLPGTPGPWNLSLRLGLNHHASERFIQILREFVEHERALQP